MKVAIVIPARYGSSRFPGKPLADIHGKPMIQHVYEKACLSKFATLVVVATDDTRIYEAVRAFGGDCVITSSEITSGTARVADVAKVRSADIYINVQSDEPLIRPSDIDLVARALIDKKKSEVVTLCHGISYEDSLNPNVVKVAKSHSGKALYFSRSSIPFGRDKKKHGFFL